MPARKLLSIELPARAESLKPLRDVLNPALDQAGVAASDRDRLVLVVNEACANIIRHAYGNSGEGVMRISLSRVRGTLRFALRDFAPAVDPKRVRPRDLSVCRPGGLGINFIDDTMQCWCLRPLKHRRGNTLIMRWRAGCGRDYATEVELD